MAKKIKTDDDSNTVKDTTARKSFSPEEKARALQLMKEGSTMNQTAAMIGCSVAALQLWKQSAKKGVKKTTPTETAIPKKRVKKSTRKGVKKSTRKAPKPKSLLTHGDLVQKYWEAHAVNGVLPPGTTPQTLKTVSDALTFAHDALSR